MRALMLLLHLVCIAFQVGLAAFVLLGIIGGRLRQTPTDWRVFPASLALLVLTVFLLARAA